MRWSLRLSEFDFVLEHNPGIRIRHAVALNRHVGVVLEDGLPSKEKILAEQGKDHFCNAQKQKVRSSHSEYFVDDDGVMYNRSREHQYQIVVPKAVVQYTIKANHNPVYIGHPGVKRTFDLISLHYCWPGMRQSIQHYGKSCDTCQRRKENREFVAPLGKRRSQPSLWGLSHGYYRPVSSVSEREQIFIDIYKCFFKICRNLPDGWPNCWVIRSFICIPGCHKTLLRIHPNNRSRPIIRFCIFQRNLQTFGNQKSKHHQFPSDLHWNGGEIPLIFTFSSLPLYGVCKH